MRATSILATEAPDARTALRRQVVIAVTAFLTLVDLFATQAILPSLTRHYGVTPAEMGFAVNTGTMGMAIAGLTVALVGRRVERRAGIGLSLALLAIPTALLAHAPDLRIFAFLRIVQGLLMATAFTLTLAYLAERSSARAAAGAAAAYITGNVASNLVGRMLSAMLADTLGVDGNFYVFAALNLAGGVLVWCALQRTVPSVVAATASSPFAAWARCFAEPKLRRAFAIGFCILFAFIGTFTYVNFVLVGPEFRLAPMTLGLVYLVFLPSIVTTPLAGRFLDRLGTRRTMWSGLAIAAAGLPLLVMPSLAAVLAGLTLVAIGTFFAQAVATGFVGRIASFDRSTASGLYLASYFSGGLVGSFVLGRAFAAFGWTGCVVGIAVALAVAALCAGGLRRHA